MVCERYAPAASRMLGQPHEPVLRLPCREIEIASQLIVEAKEDVGIGRHRPPSRGRRVGGMLMVLVILGGSR